jgi:myo-inositol-1(or 4)-monophosphatase
MFKPGPEQDAFERVEASVKLRRFGGDCYAYAMLAMGFVDLVVESSMQAYDIQALIPIVEAAGGTVTDWQGNPALDGGQILATGDARIHAQAMDLLNQ